MNRGPFPMLDDPRVYNAPIIVNSDAQLTADIATAVLDPNDNPKGQFLESLELWSVQAAAAAILLALVTGKEKPQSALNARNVLKYADAQIARVTAGAIDQLQLRIAYMPRVPRFIEPGAGVWLISSVTLAVVNWTGVMYFDNQQGGR